MSSAILIVSASFQPTDRRFKGQIYWHGPRCEAQPAHVVEFLNGRPSHSITLLACVSMKMTSYLPANLSHLRNASTDGTSERYNWVNELHALICCSFIRAARGVTTISLLHRLLYVWWVPWRENLIMQSKFLKANCFDVWSKEEGVYPLRFSFFSPCSLILQWIFKYYCDLFIAAQCSASLSYFQVDIFTGGREGGRHIDLYMGGVTLDFVTALGGVPGRASFCCCLKGSVTFSGSSPSGAERVRAGLVSSTSRYNLQRFCLKGRRGKRKGHLRHRVSRRWQDGCMLTFLRIIVCYTWWSKHENHGNLDVTYHPTVLSVKEYLFWEFNRKVDTYCKI